MAKRKRTQAPKDSFREDAESFEGFPPAVVFNEVGQMVIGHVVRYSEGLSEYGPYPILVVNDEDSGEDVSIHLFHFVLARKVMELRPVPGERVAVKYLGKKDGKDAKHDPYRIFHVKVDRVEEKTPDSVSPNWDKYFDGALSQADLMSEDEGS